MKRVEVDEWLSPDTHSQTNQTQKSSQKRPNRCAEERSRQRIPKPEHNRLDEGKGKKVAVSRKKKKSRKKTIDTCR